MSNDYICAFKKSTLYRQYLQGGPFGHGPDGNELLLRKARGSSDLTRLATSNGKLHIWIVFINHIPHLEWEEVFGSSQQPTDSPLGTNNDSHHPNHVNFFRP